MLSRNGAAVAVAALVVAASGVVSAGASSQSSVRLAQNVAPWTRQATPVAGSPHGRITLSVYLRLRNEDALRGLVSTVNDPRSQQYRQFLTPAKFRALFAPTSTDLRKVRQFLAANGLGVGYVPANRSYITAAGSVADVERAFAVDEQLFRYRGLTLRGTLQNPRLPRALASLVRYVGGLDQSDLLVHPSVSGPSAPTDEGPWAPPGPGYATPGPCSTFWADHTATVTPFALQYGSTLPWLPCGYTPAQIRAAYGVDQTGLTGAGVTVGITDAFASPTIVQDVNTFSSHYGLPLLTSSNFEQIVKPGTYHFPENKFDPQGWFGEETLDVESVHAMAPEAKIIFAGGQNSNVPLEHALIDMIDKHSVDIITNSWGDYGEPKAPGRMRPTSRRSSKRPPRGSLFSSHPGTTATSPRSRASPRAAGPRRART